MQFKNILLAVVIVLLFVLMYLSTIIAVGLKNIKKDWPKYRCNPAVMPFAGQLGHDTMTNFTFCIGNIQKNLMGFFLSPVHYLLASMGNSGGILTDAVDDVRKLQSFARTAFGGIIEDVFGIFVNILIQFQKLIMHTKDLTMKILGVMASVLYMMDGSMKLGSSIWAGPPGEILRTLCFDPTTPIRMKDGGLIAMEDVKIGDILENGSRVSATLVIEGSADNKYYKIYSKKLKSWIRATAEHKIQTEKTGRFIPINLYHGAVETQEHGMRLSCLVTNDHLIPIGEYTFWDWED